MGSFDQQRLLPIMLFPAQVQSNIRLICDGPTLGSCSMSYLPFKINMNTFPGRLTSYRCINGLSQKNLGKIIRVDASTACSWEVGKSKPQKGMLKKLVVMLESGMASI